MIGSVAGRRILADSMQKADMVTGLADSYAGVFFDLFGLSEDRYKFIPTGLDRPTWIRRLFDAAQAPALLHIGEVMPNHRAMRSPCLLARMRCNQRSCRISVWNSLVGARSINLALN